MFDVILIGAAAILQLVVTGYAVDISVREHRVRNGVVIGIVGFVAITLTVWAAYDAYVSQEKLNTEIASIKKQLSGAKVGLATIKIQPDPQELIPDKDFLVGLAFGVSEGTAKNMRCFFDAFTLDGQESAEQNRRAKSKFNQRVASEDLGTGEDRIAGTYCYKGLLVRMNKQEIKEAIAVNPNDAKRIVYAMGHVQWKNEAGADFHTDVCKWMEPPKSSVVRDPGWHDCN
jgi:hypothetical protein